MNETQTILSETCDKLFKEHVTDETLSIVAGGNWPSQLWAAIVENGLVEILDPDSGFGGDELFVLAKKLGEHFAPVPLMETIAGRSLLHASGIEPPSGALSIVCVDAHDDRLTAEASVGQVKFSGEVARVPWAQFVDHVVVDMPFADDHLIALVPTGDLSIRSGQNLAKEPRDFVQFSDQHAYAVDKAQPGALNAKEWGAVARAGAMAGVLSAVLDLCVQYVNDRVQFGRPLGRFQAIQHQLAIAASEVAATEHAAALAFRGLPSSGNRFEIASAKIRASEAAGKVAQIAHQVHGAIGFTEEYTLHHATARLWSWRSEFGTDAAWAEDVGRMALKNGSEALWPGLTA